MNDLNDLNDDTRSSAAHMVTNVHHWFDGTQREGTSRRFSDVTDPATGQVTGRLSLADAGYAGR